MCGNSASCAQVSSGRCDAGEETHGGGASGVMWHSGVWRGGASGHYGLAASSGEERSETAAVGLGWERNTLMNKQITLYDLYDKNLFTFP